MLYLDPLYMLVMLPGLALSIWASARVRSTFARYERVAAASGLTGAQAAAEMLRRAGLRGVRIERVAGFLSDHYDPAHRVLRLSPPVYEGHSLSALGVAAHEAGHALQHARGYKPLELRSLVVKPAMIGSNLGIVIAAVGLLVQASAVIWLGIVLFSAFVVFTLVTLPVELDASSRALAALRETGMLRGPEVDGAAAVLRAAALTYVAAAVSAIMQLVYFLWRAGVFSGGRD
jgi:Zn-dependent membrane protease YugP